MSAKIVPVGQPVRYEDCPPGLFERQGVFAVKVEYGSVFGRDSYLLKSGEMFWGGADNHLKREALMVQPCKVLDTINTPRKNGGAA